MKISEEKLFIYLAANLKKFRERLDLTQDELAEKSDLSPSLIRQMETGRSFPRKSTIVAVCNALQCEASDLLKNPEIKDTANENLLKALTDLEAENQRLKAKLGNLPNDLVEILDQLDQTEIEIMRGTVEHKINKKVSQKKAN